MTSHSNANQTNADNSKSFDSSVTNTPTTNTPTTNTPATNTSATNTSATNVPAKGPLSDQQRWILASNNQGKLKEFQRLFADANLPIEIVPQGELNIEDAVEDGLSFVENAIIKARHASRISGLPAIADDSGLCVPALGNAPGIFSARYAGEHGNASKNNAKLIADLVPIRAANPEAPIAGQFVCVLALVRHADDPLPIIAQGLWQGEILAAPRGEQGFGYDPLFLLPDLDQSAAELDSSVKNRLSHRGQAIEALLAQLDNF